MAQEGLLTTDHFVENNVAAGYVDPLRELEDDHRRMSDNVLHAQTRPHVYPFADITELNNKDQKPKEKDVSMYVSEFVPKKAEARKFRPTSIYRRNQPQPKHAFHFPHMLNQGIPVVKTKMTSEELNRKPVESPYQSNSHRVFRRYNTMEIDRAKPAKQSSTAANGIVPELGKVENENREVRLFPVIPRNSRLTADLAHNLTGSVIKPKKSRNQSHLRGEGADSGCVFPFIPVKDMNKPSLKPVPGGQHDDTMRVESWDGAPEQSARTTHQIFGKKRPDPTRIFAKAEAVVPELSAPTSTSLMFKEYVQYPKYAPQMIHDYYSGRTRKPVLRPYAG